MCWIIPLIVGILSAILGYLLGKKQSGNYHEECINLRQESGKLRNQLAVCEAKVSQYTNAAEHIREDNGEHSTQISGFSASGNAVINDSDIEQHALYQSLLAKYQKAQADLQVVSDGSQDEINEAMVTNHPSYLALLDEHEKLQTNYQQLSHSDDNADTNPVVSLSNNDITSHTLYQELQAKYEQSQHDYEAKIAGFTGSAPHDASGTVHLTDNDVKSHHVYTEVMDKYQNLQSDYDQLLAERNNHDTSSATNIDISAISDQDIKKHPLYLSLQAEHEQSQQTYEAKIAGFSSSANQQSDKAVLTDDEVKSHKAYLALLKKYEQADADYQTLKTQHNELESHLASNNNTNNTGDGSQHKIAGFASTASAASHTNVEFDANAAKAVFGKRIKQDDLTVVEGIGPKISELFRNAGISTWYALGETDVSVCKQILKDGGERFVIHDPGTWPRQAKLAAQGKWQELFDWQDTLDGGREP